MNPIQCLIVEDEELARDLLENFIEKIPHLALVAKCEHPLKALEVMQHNQVDLIFLDIQMPEMTGVEFLKMLPGNPTVIFTTAYPSYALEGYQLNITDYLLKPFSFERFTQAVVKASELIRLKNLDNGKNEMSPSVKDFILLNADHKVYKIKFTDINYVESMREYAAFHTVSQGRILSLISLKQLEKDLPATQFTRIHKSYIANYKKIHTLEGNLVHIKDKKLPIGASYKEEVLRLVFK